MACMAATWSGGTQAPIIPGSHVANGRLLIEHDMKLADSQLPKYFGLVQYFGLVAAGLQDVPVDNARWSS